MIARIARSIRANILVGVMLTLPIVATILIFNLFIRVTTDWLPPTVFPGFREIGNSYPLRILTLLLLLLVLYAVGVLARNFLGRRLYTLSDQILTRIPLIKGIYLTVRQISASLFTQRKTLFKEVVLVEYPRRGLYSIAFTTADAPAMVTGAVASRDEQAQVPEVSIFIATTPNPTSGVFLMAPRDILIPLDITVADALKFIMSAGAVHPGQDGILEPTLLDKLETWLKNRDEPAREIKNA